MSTEAFSIHKRRGFSKSSESPADRLRAEANLILTYGGASKAEEALHKTLHKHRPTLPDTSNGCRPPHA